MNYEESQHVFQQLVLSGSGRDVLDILSRCQVFLKSLETGGTVSVVYDPPMGDGQLANQQCLFSFTLPEVSHVTQIIEAEATI